MLRLSITPLHIPFRHSFSHAAASRHATQTVIVRAQAGALCGYGEGCPREYVTGESETSALAFFHRYQAQIRAEIKDLPSLQQWVEQHRSHIDQHPAAWCAIELAILDLFARQQQCSVEALLGLDNLVGPFHYSAVLGTSHFAPMLQRYLAAGLNQFKIKLSGNLQQDQHHLSLLQAANIAPHQVRADANQLWSDAAQAHAYLHTLNYPFAAIEEPCADSGKLSLPYPIILDESACRLAQLPTHRGQHIINLRISKMGGLLRTLEIAQACQQHQLPVIVGAQVGETSLLTRAALPIAQYCRRYLLAHEGAFGSQLLQYDPFLPELRFGMYGMLTVASQNLGWGLDFDTTH